MLWNGQHQPINIKVQMSRDEIHCDLYLRSESALLRYTKLLKSEAKMNGTYNNLLFIDAALYCTYEMWQ